MIINTKLNELFTCNENKEQMIWIKFYAYNYIWAKDKIFVDDCDLLEKSTSYFCEQITNTNFARLSFTFKVLFLTQKTAWSQKSWSDAR